MKWTDGTGTKVSNLCVASNSTLHEALAVIDGGDQAIAFVCDDAGRVIGSLTDGDVRRAILAGVSLESRCLPTTMRRDFTSVSPETSRAEVLDIMRARDIGQLPVLDDEKRLCGLHTVGELLSDRLRPNWAVIMAGGQGTRLRPLTETIPKSMLKVAGRPILERLVLHLMSCGIRRIFLSVNYLSEVIEQHFGDGSRFGCQIEYLREDRPLGTGGALALLSPPDAPVVVVNGDLVTQCDIGRMLDFHSDGCYVATIGLRPYVVEIPFGVARVENHRLVELREKPFQHMLINAGVYVVSPETLRFIPSETQYPITQLFEDCLQAGLTVGAYDVVEDWVDVGDHHQLLHARGES